MYIYLCKDIWGHYKGPRTQIRGFEGPNISILTVSGIFAPNPKLWVLGPLGFDISQHDEGLPGAREGLHGDACA